MWQKIFVELHDPERYIAFSVPKNNKLLLIDYDGTSVINLETRNVETYIEGDENKKINDENENIIDQYCDLRDKAVVKIGNDYFDRICGHFPGNAITRYNNELVIIEKWPEHIIKIFIERGNSKDLIYEYKDLSGDWNAATFSEDGQYIIIGNPYDFAIFRRD